MDLFNPFAYAREECFALDLSLARLCRRADIPRSTFYRWENLPPESILLLARLEQALHMERIAQGRDALDRAAILVNSLRFDPVVQKIILARYDALTNELIRQYGTR